MTRAVPQLWLSALRAPDAFAFSRSELALVPHDDVADLRAVTKPETINYRTSLPEMHGLFCTEVFGPGDAFPRDLERTQLGPHVRETTFGRIDLPVAAIHPLALRHCYDDVAERFGLDVRSTIDGGDEAAWSALRAKLDDPAVAPLVVRSIPVLPPYLRPMKLLEGGRWATSDVNDLYRRLINRANRLARLAELGAPVVITNNETRMIYDALDSLVANELRETPVTDPAQRPLVSLWGMAGDDRFAALSDQDRGVALTRGRRLQLAALRAMGLELRATTTAPITLGVPL